MNKSQIFKFQIFSSIFVIILGILLHFSFEFSNKNLLVGAFSAVNESTWEHLKLIFFPMLMTILIGLIIFPKNNQNFLCSKTIGILIALAFIVSFYYTYTGTLGINSSILNISSFILAVIISEFINYILIISGYKNNIIFSYIILIFLFISFILFTYFPPKLPLFKDPINSTYGIFNKILN